MGRVPLFGGAPRLYCFIACQFPRTRPSGLKERGGSERPSNPFTSPPLRSLLNSTTSEKKGSRPTPERPSLVLRRGLLGSVRGPRRPLSHSQTSPRTRRRSRGRSRVPKVPKAEVTNDDPVGRADSLAFRRTRTANRTDYKGSEGRSVCSTL